MADLHVCAQANAHIQTNTGLHVQAHGAGIVEESGTFYMIGEDKTDGSAFQNINCYSSTNLVEWTFEKALLTRQSDGDLGPNRVVERPKVIYNKATSTYVMYLHIDDSNYAEAAVGVATSDTVCGEYTYLGSSRPLGFESRDIGLFKDDDGSAYLLTEDVSSTNLGSMDLTTDHSHSATQWSPYRRTERRLFEYHRKCISLGRKHRVPSHLEGKRVLLHVRIAADRLGSQRQRAWPSILCSQ